MRRKIDLAEKRIFSYLIENQNDDGSWTPLWFGSQRAPNMENRVFGTAVVLGNIYLSPRIPAEMRSSAGRALSFLLDSQNENGSWGGCKGAEPSIEETSLALIAILRWDSGKTEESIEKALSYLVESSQKSPGGLPASPIGLYFASLWYYEKLYPLIFFTHALGLYVFSKLRSFTESGIK